MIKKILLSLGILILLVIVGIAIFLLTFDLNHYRKFAQDQLSDLLHQSVAIESMHTKLALIPTIEIQNIQISDSKTNDTLVRIPKIEATLEVMPLLFKQKLNIQKIMVDEIQLSLDKAKMNSQKVEDEENVAKSEKTSTKPIANETVKNANNKQNIPFDLSKQLWIATIDIKKITGSIKDGETTYPIELENISITGLSKFKTTITYLENKVDISGSVGSLLKLLSKPEGLTVDLQFKQNNASVTVNGKVENLKNWDKIQLNISANIPNAYELAKSWKMTLPEWLKIPVNGKLGTKGNLDQMEITVLEINLNNKDLTLLATGNAKQLIKNPTIDVKVQANLTGKIAQELKLKPLSVETDLQLSPKNIFANGMKLIASQSDLNGFIRVNPKQTPVSIQTELTSKFLDIQDLFDSDTKTTNSNHNKVTQTNTNELPWEILKKFDLTGKIQLNHLTLWNQMNDYAILTLQPTLKNGVLTSTIQSKLLAGNINSALRLNAYQKNIQLKIETGPINLDRIKAISKDVKGINVILNTSLESDGNTTDELIQKSQGNITLELLDGTIINKWFNTLPNLLKESKNTSNIYSAADSQTKILCGVINVALKEGKITSKNQITLQTDILDFVVNGDIDLTEKTLDLNMLPAWTKADNMTNNVLALTQAISLKGPWNNVSVDISASKTIQNLIKSVWNNTSSKNEFFYCERALKRPLTKLNSEKKPSKVTTVKQKTTPTEEKPKNESFKAQLVDSLAQAILKKAK